MTSTIIAALLSVIAAIIWRQQLGTMHARLVDPIKTFGAGKPALTPEERKLVLSERVKETRWAFGLAWFAVAIGIILGTVLIGRFVFAKEIDRSELAGIVGFAGDITVATSAFRLYSKASKELRDAIANL